MPFNGNDVQRLARIMTSNNQLPLSDMEQAAVIQELHNAFNQTTSEIAKLVNKSVPTVEKLCFLAQLTTTFRKKLNPDRVRRCGR
jgi:ParB-like chromosome segregation protein Spo0J